MNELNLPQIISIAAQLRESPPEALRTVLHSGPTLNLVLWQIPPGAALPPHRHPAGEDIWLVLRGHGELLDDGAPRTIRAGDSVVVGVGQSHGLCNRGTEDCVLLSVVRPDAGFIAKDDGPNCGPD